MTIETKQLGLAAYIQMNGGQLVKVNHPRGSKSFVFESDKSLTEWQIEYSNSCCSKHDSILCDLRNLIRDNN
jgi:hypothetical protein